MSRSYLVETPIGLVLFNHNGKIIEKEIFDLDPIRIAKAYSKIEQKEEFEGLSEFVTRINNLKIKQIITESSSIRSILSSKIDKEITEKTGDSTIKSIRSTISEKLISQIPDLTLEKMMEIDKAVAESITREGIRKSSGQSDAHIKHIVENYEDTLKFINVYSVRLREWYGIHFPEFTDSMVSDIKRYAEIVSTFGLRENITAESLMKELHIDPSYAEEIEKRSKHSMGAEFNEFQLSLVQSLSKQILELITFKDQLERDLQVALKEIAPNLLTLIGDQLAGKLITLAGGLKPLALMPSSTIQVLGAEKALFRALRKNAESPKHGIIYTWPKIRNSKLWQRGKISRLIAGKISICAKIDYFKGEYKGDIIKKEVDDKIQEIKEKFDEPPKKKPAPKKQKTQQFSSKRKQYAKRPKYSSKSKYKKGAKSNRRSH